jgi:gas vesicle protein
MHHRQQSQQAASSAVGASLIMGGLGLVAGLLLAPRSGKDTRVLLARKGHRIKDSLKESSNQIQDRAMTVKDNVAESVSDTVSKVSGKAREVVNEETKIAEDSASELEQRAKSTGRRRPNG